MARVPVATPIATTPSVEGVLHSKQTRTREIAMLLTQTYGERPWRRHLPPIDELVATILSQHTSDRNTERAFASLRLRFPTWLSVIEAVPAEVVDAIKSGGLANQKAPRIQAALASILDVLNVRSYDALRALIDDQAVWSLGAGPSGDTAMAMWQADASVLEAMHKVIDAGCGASSNGDVVCPAAASDPAFADWRLTLSARSGKWRISSFVQGR